MAGLDRNKKRSGSGNPRVSRFSEVLGAAHESTHKSGYPESQQSEHRAGVAKEESPPQAGYPESQQSKQSSPLAKEESTHKSGYPEIQPSKYRAGAAEEGTHKAEYPEIQQPAQPTAQPDPENPAKRTQQAGYPNSQQSSQSSTQPSGQPKSKLAKRSNPDYTQTTFRIPLKLSRQINRALMDLADEGLEIDRSDLLEELVGAFIRLADEVGVVSALSQLKNLGTQMDE
ncbi:MAG: hypothetical protein PUP93_31805 [Rhizonema sp. NSF051]|nr:hypothetical protein [Rhizonema sp. NSF051]